MKMKTKTKTTDRTKNRQALTVGKTIILAVLSLIFIFLLAVYLFLTFYKPTFEIPDLPVLDYGNAPGFELSESPENNKNNIKSDFYNILVVCGDNSNSNTDTIMVVSLDVKNKECSMLQIPRDTYTDHASWNKKINSAFPYGTAVARRDGKKGDEVFKAGIDALKNALWRTFGIAVHCYAYMDLDGFSEIVDIVGGVTVDVPFNMKYDDWTRGEELHINLSAGAQLLDGDKAEQYMRFRKNNDGTGYREGDVGRLKAQQQFIASLIKKCMKLDISQINKFINTGYKYIKTDLTALNFAFFAKEFLTVDTGDITIYTAFGEDRYMKVYSPNEGKNINLSYYLAYKEEMLELVNGKFNAYNQNLTAANLDLIEFDRKSAAGAGVTGNNIDGFYDLE